MEKKKTDCDAKTCPIGKLCNDFEEFFGPTSDFFQHMNKSRIEFLKGIRSLVDAKIGDLENKESAKKQKKSTKINVE